MIAENNNADCGNLYDQILSCPMINLTGEQKDIPAPPLQDCSSTIRNNNYTHGIAAGKTRSFLKNKRSPTSSPSASPNRLKLFHKQPSLKRATSLLSLPYSGPRPELKSCLKKPSTPPRRCCRVSFSHVNLREYCRKVGDNPSVASGCPLSIGWKYNKKGKIDIDSYEADRSCVKLGLQCRRLSNQEREVLLTEIGGVSQSQILQGQVHAYLDRQLRRETLDSIGGLKNSKSIGPRERLYIMKESAARKLDRAKRGISPTQEQDKLWEHAHEAARNRSSSSSSTSSATCGW